MELLSREELNGLVTPQEGPCVSIFMPTHRAGGETQQDPIRLKNGRGERRAKRVSSTARLCAPSRRSPYLVAPDDPRESS